MTELVLIGHVKDLFPNPTKEKKLDLALMSLFG